MNLRDITFSNIKDYIQGYSRWFQDHWRILPDYEKEQVLFRASQCPPECAKTQKCHFCKCDYPQKLFVDYSCNKNQALPDLMGKEEWEKYKTKLKIEKNENPKLP
jgi:hypothetical protein